MQGLEYLTPEIENTAANLTQTLKKFEDQIETIMAQAKALKDNGYWTGSVYEAFLERINKDKAARIDPLIQTIKNWINQIDNLAVESKNTTTANLNLMD